jgi:hypothetical protein
MKKQNEECIILYKLVVSLCVDGMGIGGVELHVLGYPAPAQIGRVSRTLSQVVLA